MTTQIERTLRTGERKNGAAVPPAKPEAASAADIERRNKELRDQVDYLNFRIDRLKTASAGPSLTDPQHKTPISTMPKTSAEANEQINQLVDDMTKATGWSRSTCRMRIMQDNAALARLAANPELAPGEQAKLWDTNPGGNPLKDPAVYEKIYKAPVYAIPQKGPHQDVSGVFSKPVPMPKEMFGARQAKERIDDLVDQLVKLEPHVSRSAARIRVMAWPANRGLVAEASRLDEAENK